MSIFGMETEYSVHLEGRVDSLGRHESDLACEVEDMFYKIKSNSGKSAIALGGQLWFGNGGNFYIDCNHPEYCTPECGSPEDLVKQMCIGDRMMEKVNTAVVRVTKSNMDYGGRSWGSHESYMCDNSREATDRRQRALLPHLATRPIYSGSGGFLAKQTPNGVLIGRDRAKFLISPKSQFMHHAIGSNTTSRRAIVNTRDEPHSSGFSRQHLVCGESLCSHISTYLRFGTTALVIAMADAGFMPKCALKSPTNVIRGLSPNMKYAVRLSGKTSTAIAIQQRYLNLAKKHKDADFMPPWAGEVCEEWDKALKLLRKGWEAVSDRFDWAIKYKIFRKFLESKGENPSFLDGRASKRLVASIDIVNQLKEIDIKFSELGKGIFYKLDKAGVLNHRIWSDKQISRSLYTPPQNSRAKERGKFVNGLKNRRNHVHISWSSASYIDGNNSFVLDLSDPRKGGELKKLRRYRNGEIVKLKKPSLTWSGWSERFAKYIGETATVIDGNYGREVHVQVKREDDFMWPIEYLEEAS